VLENFYKDVEKKLGVKKLESPFQKVIPQQKPKNEKKKEKIKDKEDGLKRGVVKSDVCVMAQKTDSTWKLITQYALEPPFIRGGTWTSVRIVYKFIVNDIGSGKVIITQLHEFSGFEDHVSFKAYEFKSNGLIEHNAIEKIKSSL
jgi:hypothetical protein